MVVPRVLPGEHERTEPFWQGALRGELVIQRCTRCGTYAHPPRRVCVQCYATDDELGYEAVSGRGHVGSWVVVHRPFLDAYRADVPYVLLSVALEEQPDVRLPAMLAEPDDGESLQLDDPLEVVFVEAGGVAVPQFRRVGA